MTSETLPLVTRKYKYWTDEMLAAEALKYETRKDFERGSYGAYQASQRRGRLNIHCSHMTPIFIFWADEMLIEEAQKYQTRAEFEQGSYGAYQSINRRIRLGKNSGLGSCFDHMVNGDFTSDENMVYIWQVGSLPIYKVGVSSWKYGSLRMDRVADQLGFTPNLIQLHKTKKGEARALESQLLEIGNPMNWEQKFNGSTEFRFWTSRHLEEALSLLCQQE